MSKFSDDEEEYFSKKALKILQQKQMEEILESHEDIKQGRVMSEEEFWKRMDLLLQKNE